MFVSYFQKCMMVFCLILDSHDILPCRLAFEYHMVTHAVLSLNLARKISLFLKHCYENNIFILKWTRRLLKFWYVCLSPCLKMWSSGNQNVEIKQTFLPFILFMTKGIEWQRMRHWAHFLRGKNCVIGENFLELIFSFSLFRSFTKIKRI